MIIGGLLTLSPAFGLLATAVAMSFAFAKLGTQGISDPQGLAHNVGTVLVSSATGLLLFPLGIIVLTVSIVFYLKSERASNPPPMPPRPAP